MQAGLTLHAGWCLACVAVFLSGCRTTPITGRSQLLLVPEHQEISMGLAAYEETRTKEPLSTNAEFQAIVTRVGQRIAKVADRPDYQWEFRLIASPEQNAYCLPGGKVTVNEGILPVCSNEAGLAVVMSHEIGHAIARHGGERMSQNMAVDGARYAVDYLTKDREQTQRDLIMKAYGVGTQYGVILPYSRKHENEADHIGLILMAKAGYDPSEAPRFWQRFAKLKEGNSQPEFLSTHPSDDHRAQNLASLLADAQAVYAESPDKNGLGEDFGARVSTLASSTATPPSQPVASGVAAGAATSQTLLPPPFVAR